MDAKLTKSLTDLIDETLGELEELRKSRFAAAEISLAGPGDTKIGGQEANGKLGKDEDKKEDKEDKKDDKKDDKDMDKGENSKADPNAGHHKPVAGEGAEHGQGPDKSSSEGQSRGSEGKNSSADPGPIHKVAKADDDKKDKKDDKEPHKDDPDHEEKEKKMAQKLMDMHKGDMKKSFEENDSLMKSYVETRVKPLEDKLTTILELVNKIAEQPVAPKGFTARGTPLFKSEDGGEPMHKAEVASKLFELKKSGTKVESLDIAKAEMGQDLAQISKKYQLS